MPALVPELRRSAARATEALCPRTRELSARASCKRNVRARVVPSLIQPASRALVPACPPRASWIRRP
eukprot:3924462-Alexandrium_andersonii.AAC.1